MAECSAARVTDEYHGWKCSITDGECMFLRPNSKRCAEMYGEGPDAYLLEEENDKNESTDNSRLIEDMIADEEGDYLSEEDEIDDIADGNY